MYIQSNPATPQSATVAGTQNEPSAPTQDGQTAQSSFRKTFARIFCDISEILQGVTPCAERLYAWLLQRAKAGKPQEVHLQDFAEATQGRKRGAYSLAHIRRALDELLNVGLVEQVFQYSGKVFKLIAYDNRSFSSQPLTETLNSETETSKKSASNPSATVPVNREKSKRSTDNPPTHPVSTDEPRKNGGGAPEVLEFLPPGVQFEILQEVEQTLGQSLNPQIRKTLLQQTINGVRNALNAFQEAKQRQTIKNPLGWLTAAVRDRFTPNATKPNHSNNPTKTPPEGFREWFELAQPLGIAIGSGFMGGVFHVHTPTEAIAWEDIRETWPLAILKQMHQPSPNGRSPSPRVATPPTITKPSPIPAPEIINNLDCRASSLARLQLKYKDPNTRGAAIAECEHWGFEIGPDGPKEVDF